MIHFGTQLCQLILISNKIFRLFLGKKTAIHTPVEYGDIWTKVVAMDEVSSKQQSDSGSVLMADLSEMAENWW